MCRISKNTRISRYAIMVTLIFLTFTLANASIQTEIHGLANNTIISLPYLYVKCNLTNIIGINQTFAIINNASGQTDYITIIDTGYAYGVNETYISVNISKNGNYWYTCGLEDVLGNVYTNSTYLNVTYNQTVETIIALNNYPPSMQTYPIHSAFYCIFNSSATLTNWFIRVYYTNDTIYADFNNATNITYGYVNLTAYLPPNSYNWVCGANSTTGYSVVNASKRYLYVHGNAIDPYYLQTYKQGDITLIIIVGTYGLLVLVAILIFVMSKPKPQ